MLEPGGTEGYEMNGIGLDQVSTECRECLPNAGTGRDEFIIFIFISNRPTSSMEQKRGKNNKIR